jgi:hypothetical protein
MRLLLRTSLAALLFATAFQAAPVAASGVRKSCHTIASTEKVDLPAPVSGGVKNKLTYKIGVSVKFCLHYTTAKRKVDGRSVKQVSVRKVESSTKVSHSGYLPSVSGSGDTPDFAALDRSGSYTDYPAFVVIDNFEAKWANGRFALTGSGDAAEFDTGWHAMQDGRALYQSLKDAGFTCRGGRCKPKKSSVTGPTVTYVPGSDVVNAGAIFSPEDNTRTGITLWVSALGVAKHVQLYWDTGDICPADACTGKTVTQLRAANSIRKFTEISVRYSRGPFLSFLGIPAEYLN